MSEASRQARVLIGAGRDADAEARLRAALAAAPDEPELLVLLTFVLRRRRDYPGSLRAGDAAVAADPGRSDAHAERAETLLALLRDADAGEAAREAVRLDPYHPDNHFVLARALAAGRRFDEARAAAGYGLSLDPRSVPGLLTLADVERDAGHRDEAERVAREALELDPTDPYGRWLIAMLDAERLRVRRSLRTLRDMARDNPARADVLSMTWPIRSLLAALRRWLGPATLLVVLAALAALAARRWPVVLLPGRVLAVLFAVVVLGFGLRVLVPAGRVPWRCLRLVPWVLRRATRAAVVVVGVIVTLLLGYAVTGAWWLPLIALAGAPVLWLLGLAEMVGARMDDPGYLEAFRDLRRELREWTAELRQWWADTRRELRAVWTGK